MILTESGFLCTSSNILESNFSDLDFFACKINKRDIKVGRNTYLSKLNNYLLKNAVCVELGTDEHNVAEVILSDKNGTINNFQNLEDFYFEWCHVNSILYSSELKEHLLDFSVVKFDNIELLRVIYKDNPNMHYLYFTNMNYAVDFAKQMMHDFGERKFRESKYRQTFLCNKNKKLLKTVNEKFTKLGELTQIQIPIVFEEDNYESYELQQRLLGNVDFEEMYKELGEKLLLELSSKFDEFKFEISNEEVLADLESLMYINTNCTDSLKLEEIYNYIVDSNLWVGRNVSLYIDIYDYVNIFYNDDEEDFKSAYDIDYDTDLDDVDEEYFEASDIEFTPSLSIVKYNSCNLD